MACKTYVDKTYLFVYKEKEKKKRKRKNNNREGKRREIIGDVGRSTGVGWSDLKKDNDKKENKKDLCIRVLSLINTHFFL